MNAHVTQAAIAAATTEQTVEPARAACRDCSGWKIAAERALEALLDEMKRGDGRVRLDVSAATFARLMETDEVSVEEIDAGCAYLAGAAGTSGATA